MLIHRGDPIWKDNPPEPINRFLQLIEGYLGNSWRVSLNAYDCDLPDDVENISAEVCASYGDLAVTITRHARCDTVVVGILGVARSFPFEDLAVASGWSKVEDLLGILAQDPTDLNLLIPLADVLRLINDSRDKLVSDLREDEFVKHLDLIAALFKNQLLATNS